MLSETAFRRSVKKFLVKLPNSKEYPIQQVSIKGDPDYFVCIRGKMIWLELKKENGKERVLQKVKRQEHEVIAKGLTIVARPSNWEDVKVQLTELAGGSNE